MTDYTLTAAFGALALLGGGTDGTSRADPGTFALVGANVSLIRTFTIDLGDLTLKLDPLKKQIAYYNPDGTPTVQGMLIDQRRREAHERAFNKLAEAVAGIQAALNTAAQAALAASEANNAVAQVQTEVSSVAETVTAIEDGTYNFPTITVGGAAFAYDGYSGLVPF